MQITIEGTPPSLNEWAKLHWSRQRELKTEWGWKVKAAVLTKRIRPAYKYAKITIILIFPQIRIRDVDNYAPKFILDALVNSGVILDDRSDWVTVEWRMVKGPVRQTIIDVQNKE